MIVVPEPVLERFRAFSLYNSPYRAHDDGSAIDLYPEAGAPSPVAGEVVAIERVRAPPKPYAPEHDYLLAIDTGATGDGSAYSTEDDEPAIARILHVDPSVEIGDRVAVGDPLGTTIRAGFFAPWVDDHLHLGFRRPGDDLVRASGSLPLTAGVDVDPVAWDGTGTVVETGETYAVLDRPRHPAPGERFAAIGATHGEGEDGPIDVPLDGGLPHYDHGGILARQETGQNAAETATPVELLGARVGTATGRTVAWDGPTVTVDGTPIDGLSLAVARNDVGAKLICPALALSVGDEVCVRIE